MSSSGVNLEKYRIPLEEIIRATNNFSSDTVIGRGGFGVVHRCQWQNRTVAIKRLNQNGYQGKHEFRNELQIVSSFHHPNIIAFLGYYDDEKEMIIVFEYAVKRSLDLHLQDPDKRCDITWAQRLQICLGVAKGLQYLHSGEEHMKVIHRDMKSANILLDENLNAKICDFGLSRFGPRNQPDSEILTRASGTRFYIDPIYNERGRLYKESDIYSFGVVLFEMSSGMLAHAKCFGDNNEQYLMDLVRSYYDDQEHDGLDKLIDPLLRGHIDMRSFHTFNEIAHECVNLTLKERPTMDRIIRKIEEALNLQNQEAPSIITRRSLESFHIPLQEIILATEGFKEDKRIGGGQTREVYKGQLFEHSQNRLVAINRLNQEHVFRKEIQMMSTFYHQNIISFIGYCDERNETIIVYEYAVNGNLHDHLLDPSKRSCLTWAQRLKICVGAARGLHYLHSGLHEDSRGVIHGSIKSKNILLNENLEARICNFALSRQGPANRQLTRQLTAPRSGTDMYRDPTYQENSSFHEEADIYSFGLVLFEILSGRLAYQLSRLGDGKLRYLGGLVQRYYRDGLERLIDPLITDQIDGRCYDMLKEIAYQCLSYDTKARPTILTVLKRIEDAADCQGIIV